MLSKTEQEYLRNPSSFNPDYAKVLKCRVTAKARVFNQEISLLSSAGLVTQNCNQVTEFSNQNQGINQPSALNQGQNWSLRRDLDPRPLPYQGNAPPD